MLEQKNLTTLLSKIKRFTNSKLACDGEINQYTWQCTVLTPYNHTSLDLGFQIGKFSDVNSKSFHAALKIDEINLSDIGECLHSVESLDKFIQISICPLIESDLLFAMANTVHHKIREFADDGKFADDVTRLSFFLNDLALTARRQA